MKQKENILAVGIDVAKASLSVCLRFQDGSSDALRISNIDTEIKTLAKKLSGFKGKIVMESTGHYHWLTSLILSEAGLDVRVINPILAKKYSSSSIRKVKTDKADAEVLASIAILEKDLPEGFCYSREKLILRKRLGLMANLQNQIKAIEACLKSFQEANEILKSKETKEERKLITTVKHLKEQIKKMELDFAKEAQKADEDKLLAKLSSIPGVSPFVSALIVHFFSQEEGVSAKSWIAYAGLDVSSRESGTWQGKCHLTKRGNNFLRKRIYGAAWGAVMNNESFKNFYQHLRNNGRGHVEALVIIARKLTCIMFGVVKNKTNFDARIPLYATK